ncbi:hypothetical protein [Gemmatimonas sp.]|uniref:hypothetical protein n=1 Tax=Gemmatimonas sp. TaxID=1962908 RepID=UPI0033402F6E
MRFRHLVSLRPPRGGAPQLSLVPGRVLAAVALGALTACGGLSDGSVTVKGDVEGLDTLALRGDSLLAQAEWTPERFDAMKREAQEEIAKALRDSLGGTLPSGGAGNLVPDTKGPASTAVDSAVQRAALAVSQSAGSAMSRRAQARGDSMARAFAAQLAGATNGADRARSDTVRGQLVWQGEEPARVVVLRTGTTTTSLSGMATTGMSKLVGSEVVVRGVRLTPRDVVVSDYLVRAADGVPAYDGTLLPDGSLRLTDGSGIKRVPLPTALQGMSGVRVWVAVQGGKPFAFGVIPTR